jgi:hypothetical protein
MAATPELKKKAELDPIAKRINELLEMASNSRKQISPEMIQQYYMTGEEARQKLDATPSKKMGAIVARRNEEKKQEVTVKVGHKEMEASIDLATSLEIAANSGKRFDPGAWIKKG